MASAATAGSFTARRAPLLSLLAANIISRTGSGLTSVAVPWFVLVTTGSAAKTGITAAVGIVPVIIAGALGGTLVDRAGFKRTSVVSDLLGAVAIGLIPLFYLTVGLSFPALLLLLFLGRLLAVPGDTARISLMPGLAGLADMSLERANAGYSSARSLAGLVGPVLAGILIAVLGASNVLFLDAASFAVSAVLVGVGVPAAREVASGREERSGYFAELRAGFVYLLRDGLMLVIMISATLINFVGTAVGAVVLPVYAKQRFGSSVDLGVILGADGIGALAGTLLYGVVARRLPRRGIFLGSLLVAGTVGLTLALLPGVAVVALVLATIGLAVGPLSPMVQTIVQERVPQAFLGRIFGLFDAVSMLAAPLGVLVAGFLLQFAGLRTTILLEMGGTLIVALGLLAVPALRQLD